MTLNTLFPRREREALKSQTSDRRDSMAILTVSRSAPTKLVRSLKRYALQSGLRMTSCNSCFFNFGSSSFNCDLDSFLDFVLKIIIMFRYVTSDTTNRSNRDGKFQRALKKIFPELESGRVQHTVTEQCSSDGPDFPRIQ